MLNQVTEQGLIPFQQMRFVPANNYMCVVVPSVCFLKQKTSMSKQQQTTYNIYLKNELNTRYQHTTHSSTTNNKTKLSKQSPQTKRKYKKQLNTQTTNKVTAINKSNNKLSTNNNNRSQQTTNIKQLITIVKQCKHANHKCAKQQQSTTLSTNTQKQVSTKHNKQEVINTQHTSPQHISTTRCKQQLKTQ